MRDQVKEELCYVSLNVPNDLKVSKMNRRGGLDPFGGSLKRSFVLPDFQHVMRGYVKPEGEAETSSEQLLVMEAERFTVPEVLFSPNEVGIQQAGVAEATWQCLSKLDQVPPPHPPSCPPLLCSSDIMFFTHMSG